MKRPTPPPYIKALLLAEREPERLRREELKPPSDRLEDIDSTALFALSAVPGLTWAGYIRREDAAYRITERGLAVLERQRAPRAQLPSVEVLELPWGLEGEEAIEEEVAAPATASLAPSPELATAMEANASLQRFARAASDAGCELAYHAERSERCADSFDHYEVRRGAVVVTRLCADGPQWWLLEGQKREPITAEGLVEHLAPEPPAPEAAALEASPAPPAPAPAPKPRTCREAVLDLLAERPLPQQQIHTGHAEGTVKGTLCKLEREGLVERYTAPVTKGGRDYASTWWRLVVEEAPAPAPPPRPQPAPPQDLPWIDRKAGSCGFVLEEVPGDSGSLKIIPNNGVPGFGTLDFDELGRLVCCAWEMEHTRSRIVDLGGIGRSDLLTWMMDGWEALRVATPKASPKACTPRRVAELIDASGLRRGCLLGQGYDTIHPAEPGSPEVGRIVTEIGLTVQLIWNAPWGQGHSLACPAGAEEADVARWLAPWLERQEEAAPKAPPLTPSTLSNEPPPLIKQVRALAASLQRELEVALDATRQRKAAPGVACWKVCNAAYKGGRILARLEIHPHHARLDGRMIDTADALEQIRAVLEEQLR